MFAKIGAVVVVCMFARRRDCVAASNVFIKQTIYITRKRLILRAMLAGGVIGPTRRRQKEACSVPGPPNNGGPPACLSGLAGVWPTRTLNGNVAGQIMD